MNLLLETIEKLPQTAELKQAIAQGGLPCSLARVAAGAKQHLAKSISGGRDVLFVCATEYEAPSASRNISIAIKSCCPPRKPSCGRWKPGARN